MQVLDPVRYAVRWLLGNAVKQNSKKKKMKKGKKDLARGQFCRYTLAMFTEDQITQGAKAALNHLTLASYEFNRILKPEISPQRWELVYGTELVKKMEIAFQEKKALTIDV